VSSFPPSGCCSCSGGSEDEFYQAAHSIPKVYRKPAIKLGQFFHASAPQDPVLLLELAVEVWSRPVFKRKKKINILIVYAL